MHDIILFYVKSEKYIFNQQFAGLREEYMQSHYNQIDEQGRRYQLTSLAATGPGQPDDLEIRCFPHQQEATGQSQEKIDKLMESKRIVFTSRGFALYPRTWTK